MSFRSPTYPLAVAVLLVLTACGGDDVLSNNNQGGESDATTDTTFVDAAGFDAAETQQPDSLAEAVCPPEGPYGTAVDDILPNITLTTCEGEAIDLHSVCDRDATLLIGFAEWCTRCARRAPELQALYEELTGEDANIEAVIVVTENSNFGLADANTCVRIRERYGFTMPVVFSSSGEFESVLMQRVNDSSVVLDRGLRVVSRGQNVTTPTLEAELRRLLP